MTKGELLEVIRRWENLELAIQETSTNPEHLPVLMNVALNSDEPHSWRAAWMVDKIHEKFPHLVIPWINEMTLALKQELKVGKKRHFLKLISLNNIDKMHYSFLMEYCINTFTSGSEAVAVRVHAMQVLFNISESEPGFKPELLNIIEHEMEIHPSAGIRSRGEKLAMKLNAQIKQLKL